MMNCIDFKHIIIIYDVCEENDDVYILVLRDIRW